MHAFPHCYNTFCHAAGTETLTACHADLYCLFAVLYSYLVLRVGVVCLHLYTCAQYNHEGNDKYAVHLCTFLTIILMLILKQNSTESSLHCENLCVFVFAFAGPLFIHIQNVHLTIFLGLET